MTHSHFCTVDTTSFRQGQAERKSGFFCTESEGGGCLFKNNDNLKTKSTPVDVIITNPCGNTLLDRSTRRSGYATREVASAENHKFGGTSPAIFHYIPPLAISACGEKRLGTQRLITALAEAKVDKPRPRRGGRLPWGERWRALRGCCHAVSTELYRFSRQLIYAARGSSLCPQQKRRQQRARGWWARQQGRWGKMTQQQRKWCRKKAKRRRNAGPDGAKCRGCRGHEVKGEAQETGPMESPIVASR